MISTKYQRWTYEIKEKIAFNDSFNLQFAEQYLKKQISAKFYRIINIGIKNKV